MPQYRKNQTDLNRYPTVKNTPVSNFFCQLNLTKKQKTVEIRDTYHLVPPKMAEIGKSADVAEQAAVLHAELADADPNDKSRVRKIVGELVNIATSAALVVGVGVTAKEAIQPKAALADEDGKGTKVAQVVPVAPVVVPGINLDAMLADVEREAEEAGRRADEAEKRAAESGALLAKEKKATEVGRKVLDALKGKQGS